MKFNDALSGIVLLVLALALLFSVQSFPTIPGQNVGPAVFPGLIAVLLAFCAVMLIVKGLQQYRRDGAWIVPGRWLKSWPHVRNFVVTCGSLMFYILASDRIGFIAAGMVVLGAMFLTLGVRKRLILPISAAVVLLIHTIFYKGLRVPLPWGWLQSVSW